MKIKDVYFETFKDIYVILIIATLELCWECDVVLPDLKVNDVKGV